MASRIGKVLGNRWLLFALRLALGGVFIASSVGKLSHQAEFVSTVVSYDLLPGELARWYGYALPWVELLIGTCLILGILSVFASALTVPVVLSFVIANGYRLSQAGDDTCGCFGDLIPLSYSASIAVDAAMIVAAVILLLGRDRLAFLSMERLLPALAARAGGRRRFLAGTGARFALVGAVVLAAGIPTYSSVSGSVNSQIDSGLSRNMPVFVDFYIAGCGECEEQKPVIERLEDDYRDRVVFVHVNYKEQPQAVLDFDVHHTPTMFLITGKSDNGEYTVYQRFDSFTDSETLRNCIEGAV